MVVKKNGQHAKGMEVPDDLSRLALGKATVKKGACTARICLHADCTVAAASLLSKAKKYGTNS